LAKVSKHMQSHEFATISFMERPSTTLNVSIPVVRTIFVIMVVRLMFKHHKRDIGLLHKLIFVVTEFGAHILTVKCQSFGW
jgi:hypothetical protein